MSSATRSQRLTFVTITGDSFLASALAYVLEREFGATPLALLARPHHVAHWPASPTPDLVVLDGRVADAPRCRVDAQRRWPAADIIVTNAPLGAAVSERAPVPLAPSHCIATVDALIDCIRSTKRCNLPTSGFTLPIRWSAARRPGHAESRWSRTPLSAREWQVVALLHEGHCNKEIARELAISVATVKNHIHHILEKLGAERRGQIVARVRADDPARSPTRRW